MTTRRNFLAGAAAFAAVNFTARRIATRLATVTGRNTRLALVVAVTFHHFAKAGHKKKFVQL